MTSKVQELAQLLDRHILLWNQKGGKLILNFWQDGKNRCFPLATVILNQGLSLESRPLNFVLKFFNLTEPEYHSMWQGLQRLNSEYKNQYYILGLELRQKYQELFVD